MCTSHAVRLLTVIWAAMLLAPRSPSAAPVTELTVMSFNIWGNGEQTRSFMYIDDCVKGIDKIMHCDQLLATPINLGSSELISINDLQARWKKSPG